MSANSEEDVFRDVAGGASEGGGAGGLASPEPEPQGQTASASPWWEEVCARIARGEAVDAVQAGLAVQQQAQAFAKAERLASESAASSAQQSLLAALSLRDQQIADLQRDLKSLKDQEDDKEPENREFCPRAADNPFGVIVGSERSGAKAEPCLRHYPTEKAFSFVTEQYYR
eukprot:COSAG01_NODE_29985_length_625_cov_2.836502_1_plen_172_part_00